MPVINFTYHTIVVRIIDSFNEVAIITAATLLGSSGGSLGGSVLHTDGIPRGRTNVSGPTTPGGDHLRFINIA
jgi:hypothetical protein